MPWKKIVAREWLKFIKMTLLSIPLGIVLGAILEEYDIHRVRDLEDFILVIVVVIVLIYSFLLTLWSMDQRKKKEE